MRKLESPIVRALESLEHDLHTAVAFGILPLFAFANAGIALGDVSLDQLSHGVPLGVAAGLLVGKMVGVFGSCWVAAKLGVAALPERVDWPVLWGAATLCGVGFTMSPFIGSLAFEQTGVNRLFDERLGILVGSGVSGVLGYLILRMTLPAAPASR